MISPFAPHFCEELWSRLGHGSLILSTPWPQGDEAAAKDEAIEVVVQVNGKVRGRLQVAPGTADDVLRSLALEEPNVARHVEGKTIRKVVVVRGKLVNVVAR